MSGSIDVCGPFTRIKWEQFNLNSMGQIKDYLLTQGWRPDTWNYKKNPKTGRKLRDAKNNYIKSSPKITESSLDSVQTEVGRLIGKRATLIHRRNCVFNITTTGKLTGYINLVRSDGRIEAGGIPQATNTGRYRHSGVVNVPQADNPVYGHALRSLFTVPEGKKMMGIDASGLEARMEAHYCYDFPGGEEYAKDLIEGDIHSKNAVAFNYYKEDGTPDRQKAKSPKYAMTYGSQPAGLADTMGISIFESTNVFNSFWENNTALAAFRDTVTRIWEKRGGKNGGYLRGLDGRKLYARSEHSLVNMMFQSAGSIVVKTASVFLDHWIKQEGLDAHRVIHYHDEFQLEYDPVCEERLKELALKSFIKAGAYWGMKVPIEGDVKIGQNWACTH